MHVYELENVSVQYSGRSQPALRWITGTIVVTAIPIRAKVVTLPKRSTQILAELFGVKGSSLIDLISRPTRMHANLLATGFTER